MATYIEDSSIYLYKKSALAETKPAVSITPVNDTASEPLFSNTQNTQTLKEETIKAKDRKTKIRNINKKDLVKRFKDNPMGVIQELGIELTPQELNQLQSLLTDKKSLQQFLNIVDKSNLTPQDLIGALDHETKRKGSNWFKRTWTRITEGRSEHEINADNFSREMSEVRESRQDFSTNTVVDIADTNEANPENKENVMHFVEAKTTNGKAVYTEENVTDAVAYIKERPDDADEFVSITTELESIVDEHGVPKYTGTTMINVGKRSVENPKLKETNLKIAHKGDMTDEFLENITKNLFENPDMQSIIDYSLGAKNKDGSDKFSAGNINDESNQLVDKALDFCNSYLDNLKTLSKYGNLSSDDIIKITQNVTAHPEIYNDVISKLESGMSGSEVAEYSSQCAQAAQNGSYNAPQTTAGINNTDTASSFGSYSNTDIENAQKEKMTKLNEGIKNSAKNKQNNKFELILQLSEITDIDEQNSSNTVQIAGKYYAKDKLKAALYRQFGTISGRVFNKIVADPNFIETIKQYNGNKVIIEALLKNPELINKIDLAGTLSNKERAEIIGLCTDSGSTNVMLAALESGSVTDAIRTTKMAKITNAKDDTLAILTSNNKSNSNKKQELQQLYGINDKCNFMA